MLRRSLLLFPLWAAAPWRVAIAAPEEVGIVMLHGKQSAPRIVAPLAQALRGAGFKVSTPEMAWSRRRDFDIDYPEALAEIDAAASQLTKEGARRIVVGGHSFGANAVLAYGASGRPVAGLFMIAPGHVPDRGRFRRAVEPGVTKAREMVAAGKGSDTDWFPDVNQGRLRQVRTTASAYLSYFDPDGIAAMPKSAASLARAVPFFLAVGDADPAFAYAETAIFRAVPQHPSSQYVTLQADHMGALAAAVPQLLAWLRSLPD